VCSSVGTCVALLLYLVRSRTVAYLFSLTALCGSSVHWGLLTAQSPRLEMGKSSLLEFGSCSSNKINFRCFAVITILGSVLMSAMLSSVRFGSLDTVGSEVLVDWLIFKWFLLQYLIKKQVRDFLRLKNTRCFMCKTSTVKVWNCKFIIY